MASYFALWDPNPGLFYSRQFPEQAPPRKWLIPGEVKPLGHVGDMTFSRLTPPPVVGRTGLWGWANFFILKNFFKDGPFQKAVSEFGQTDWFNPKELFVLSHQCWWGRLRFHKSNDKRYCSASADAAVPIYMCRNPLMCAPDETSTVIVSIGQNNAFYEKCMFERGYKPY